MLWFVARPITAHTVDDTSTNVFGWVAVSDDMPPIGPPNPVGKFHDSRACWRFEPFKEKK